MINLGLSRIQALIAQHPISWKAIHIAGTNGKGTVAAYLSSALHRSGVRVGRFTSPHLIDRWDGITVSEKTVDETLFREVESDVLQRMKGWKDEDKATEFEVLTATAFAVFERERVQVGVIECGVGGKGDATNVLMADQVLVSVITKIGLDHIGLLGTTIEEIATQKSGIFKKGVPAVADGSNQIEVLRLLQKQAEMVGVDLTPASRQILGQTGISQEVLSRLLPHQKDNLAVAVHAFSLASGKVPEIDNTTSIGTLFDEVVVDVQANWQGRLQWISLEKLTGTREKALLDGAHNAQSATVLNEYVELHVRKQKRNAITWVLAMTQGKDAEKILQTFLRPQDSVITCGFGPVDGMPWVKCMDPTTLATVAGKICHSTPSTFASDALKLAAHSQTRSGEAANTVESAPVVVAGSLYLVSDVLRLLRDGEEALSARVRPAVTG